MSQDYAVIKTGGKQYRVREGDQIDIEKISAANNPAVVPPKTRTNANTAIAVNEPATNGNIIVKS